MKRYDYPVYIYGMQDPRTEEIRYVGKSIYKCGRLDQHKVDNYNAEKSVWLEELEKDGLEPTHIILEEVPSGGDWVARERHWIKHGLDNSWPLVNIVVPKEPIPDDEKAKGRIAVLLPAEMKRAFHIACAMMDKTMTEVLRAAMLETIERSNEQKRRGDAETEI